MGIKRKTKKVRAGLSTEHSVSYIVNGYVVSSIYDNNGDKYNCVFKHPGHGDAKENIDKLMNIFSLLLMLVASIIVQNIIKSIFGSLTYLMILEIITLLFIVSMLTHSLGYMLSKDSRMFKNHGAEHKVFNAASKKGGIPTLDEARNASRFCPWCGVKVFSIIISLTLLNIILAAFNLYVIPFGIVMAAGYVLPGYDPVCYFIQKRKTTSEPTDKELQLALDAYTAAYEISNGRQPKREETPTNEKLFNYMFNLNARLGPNDKVSYEDVKNLDAFKDRIEIENEILETVFGSILR